MENMPLNVFLTSLVIIWIGFSVYAIIIWLQFTPNLKTVLKDAEKHWSVKFVIYYGISFSIFLITIIGISFIVLLSNFLLKGF